MEERHLLLEKEVSVKAETQTKQAETQSQGVELKHAFSSKIFASTDTEQEQEKTTQTEYAPQLEPQQSSSVIEKPNYDFIDELTSEEEKKVYKIEREKGKDKPKSFSKKLRLALFSLVASVGIIWGIVNVVEITTLQAQIDAVTQQYQLNLANYLAKLGTLDTASSYNELFETTPSETVPPASVSPSSNWFDRICNFIAGMFGG